MLVVCSLRHSGGVSMTVNRCRRSCDWLWLRGRGELLLPAEPSELDSSVSNTDELRFQN